MSHFPSDGGHFEPSQWDNHAEFLDQSIAFLDSGYNNWLEGSIISLIDAPDTMAQSSQNATSGVYGTGSSTSNTSISSPDKYSQSFAVSPVTEQPPATSKKSHNTSKGRPKLSRDDPNFATEVGSSSALATCT
jgi:hypothetical protein